MSGFERSLKIEFSGIYLPIMLCTSPLHMSEFCALLFLPTSFYPANNWNPRHKCHIVPITQHTGSSVIKYSDFIKRKKRRKTERERSAFYKDFHSSKSNDIDF